MDLFLPSPESTLEKRASEVKLPEDPNQWPTEILQECYKQVPYISDFDPRIVMDRVDGERGFGFGHIEVKNKSEAPLSTSPASEQAAGIRTARIPIIIREGKLSPLDLVVTADSNKFMPLTEKRLRQAIFRPQMFDITSKTPGDQSLIGQLYPPNRSSYGYGGAGAAMDGMGKVGEDDRSKKSKEELLLEIAKRVPGVGLPKVASILQQILPTINTEDYLKFASVLSDDASLAALYQDNYAAAPSLRILSRYEGGHTAKLASQAAQLAPPSVMQITKVAEGYCVKTASHTLWAPASRVIDRGTLVKQAGVKLALEVDTQGSVTAVRGAEVDRELGAGEPTESIKSFGIWKVHTTEGKELIGYVFPTLLDLDGQPVPVALFTNGSQAALQADMVGTRVGEGASLFEGQPSGKGIFYQVRNGKAVGTIPLTIHARLGAHGVSYLADTFDGKQVHVHLQSGVQIPTVVDEKTAIIPAEWSWLPLDHAETVCIAEEADKTASLRHQLCGVTIRCAGPDCYSLRGMPVEKIASAQREFISFNDALFLLGGLGVSPAFATEKLACALHFPEPILCRISRPLATTEEVVKVAATKTASVLAKIPNLRRHLVKEAAFLPDPLAVDTVLSLGFINPENIHTFVAALPVLEESQQKMCELLLGARMGLPEVPVSALEKAIRATEEVYEGLKVLAFQQE